MSENKSRNLYMDIMRIVACLMVILCHISAFCMDEVPYRSSQFQAMIFYDSFSFISIDLFMMISGAIHLNENYTLDIKRLYTKKIFRFAITFFFWLTFYNIFDFIEYQRAWTFDNIKFYIAGRVIRGQGTYHLWFLPMMIFIYAFAPILKPAFATKKICEYYLVLHTLFVVFIPTLLLIDFPGKEWLVYNINMPFFSELRNYFGYIGYFIMGHYIHSFIPKQSRKNTILCVICIVISQIITASVSGYMSIRFETIHTELLQPFTLFMYTSAICLYILIRDWSSDLEDLPKWVKVFGSLSFGVYLIHPAVLRIYYHLGVKTTFIHAALMIPVLVIVTALISSAITFILTKIPAFKRLV